MLYLIEPNSPPNSFPPSSKAREHPNGLLAVGGDLSIERLLFAYRKGYFPWYSEGDPILWWTPNPRCVLFPQDFKTSRSLAKSIRNRNYVIKQDTVFDQVINRCAGTKRKQQGTWINEDMIQAYNELFYAGFAHSIEVWHENQLIGGLYGIQLGSVFFGESMFSLKTDASKVAFHFLANRRDINLIDCQVRSEHIMSLGACEIHRQSFEKLLLQNI